MGRLHERQAELESILARLDRGFPQNDYVRLVGDDLTIAPVRGEDTPESAEQLRDHIVERLPKVDLRELLIEVDRWIGFTARSSTRAGQAAAGRSRASRVSARSAKVTERFETPGGEASFALAAKASLTARGAVRPIIKWRSTPAPESQHPGWCGKTRRCCPLEQPTRNVHTLATYVAQADRATRPDRGGGRRSRGVVPAASRRCVRAGDVGRRGDANAPQQPLLAAQCLEQLVGLGQLANRSRAVARPGSGARGARSRRGRYRWSGPGAAAALLDVVSLDAGHAAGIQSSRGLGDRFSRTGGPVSGTAPAADGRGRAR